MIKNTHGLDEPKNQSSEVVTGNQRARAKSRLGQFWQRFELTSMPLQALMFAIIFGLLGGGVLLVKDYALTPECINQNTSELHDISQSVVRGCLLKDGLLKVALSGGSTVTTHGSDPIMPTQVTQVPVTANANGVLVEATDDTNPATPSTQPTDSISSVGADTQAASKALVAQVKNLSSHLLVAKRSNDVTAPAQAVALGTTATKVTAASTDPSLITTKPLAPYCATDYYGELIYVVPSTAAYDTTGPGKLVTAFEQANGFLHDQGAPFNVDVRYKMLCNGSSPYVIAIRLNSADPNFSQVVSELQARGYNRPNVKYWVYVQGRGGSDFQNTCGGNTNCFFGMGTLYEDDRLSSDNASNGYYPEYGVVFDVPWNYAPSLLMHEDGHNQGAVQLSAPQTDHNLHCKVSYAIMCYGGTQYYSCRTLAFDCGDDNYFSPAPAQYNYLRTHWNIGSSLNHFVRAVPPNRLPIGHFDGVRRVPGGVQVVGWSVDPDTPTTAIEVAVYGDTGSSSNNPHGERLLANQARPDVGNAYPSYGPNHGFNGFFPIGTDYGSQRFCAYGIDTSSGSSSLSCNNITISPNPFGHLDSAVRVSGGIQVTGWAVDPDVAASINVDTYGGTGAPVAGNPAVRTLANISRTNLTGVDPAYGTAHGFSVLLPILAANTAAQNICIYGINNAYASGSTNPQLGCIQVQ